MKTFELSKFHLSNHLNIGVLRRILIADGWTDGQKCVLFSKLKRQPITHELYAITLSLHQNVSCKYIPM